MTLDEALRPALDRLRGRHDTRYTKEVLIVEMMKQMVLGLGFDNQEFWERDDTPARSTYMNWRKSKLFVSVLEECRTITREWRTKQTAVSVEEALIILQLKSPDAARKVAELVDDPDGKLALTAATKLLDRASVDTGKKQQPTMILPNLHEALDFIYGDEDETEEEE